MFRRLFLMTLVIFVLHACKNEKDGDLTGQLTVNFSNHIQNIAPTLVLDSFRLIKTDTFFEKQGRMIDVFIYQREADKIKNQLKNAIEQELGDSASFYAYENNYIQGQIDSLSKLVAIADTTRPFGLAAHCEFWVSKKDKSRKDSVLYFFDNTMKLLDPDRIDSSISRASRYL
jgi:hypothetical protein